jgi:hypothetical protein
MSAAAERDEHGAHHERREDAEREHALLVLGWHRERGHDHDETKRLSTERLFSTR